MLKPRTLLCLSVILLSACKLERAPIEINFTPPVFVPPPPASIPEPEPTTTPGIQQAQRPSARIERDIHGIAHIVAKNNMSAAYAAGWAQAQDYPVDLLLRFIFSSGRSSQVADDTLLTGLIPWQIHTPLALDPGLITSLWHIDEAMHFFRVPQNALSQYEALSSAQRRELRAFARGINESISGQRSMLEQTHPELAAAGIFDFVVEPTAPLTIAAEYLSSTMVYELQKVRRKLNEGEEIFTETNDYIGPSNEWAISGARSSTGLPLLMTDPHLPAFNRRYFFYPMQMTTDAYNVGGSTLLGLPFIVFGHSDYASWAFTANGPDIFDIYRHSLDPQDPQNYFHGPTNSFVAFEEQDIALSSTEHIALEQSDVGWVFGRDNNNEYAYSIRIAKDNNFNIFKQFFALNRAKNYSQLKAALAQQELPMLNIVIATNDNHIGYLWNGVVPKRSAGHNYMLVQDGDDLSTHWQGLHGFDELPQLWDPPSGYLLNHNVSPNLVTANSGITLSDYPDYMVFGHTPLDSYRQQRARTLIDTHSGPITPEDLQAMGTDLYNGHAQDVVDLLNMATNDSTPWGGALLAQEPEILGAVNQLVATFSAWDKYAHQDSEEQAYFASFLFAYKLLCDLDYEDASACKAAVGGGRAQLITGPLSPEFSRTAFRALSHTIQYFPIHFGSDATWGDIQRLVLDDGTSLALGGGPDCLRAVASNMENDGFKMVGGQTWVMLVEHGNPIRSSFLKPTTVGASDNTIPQAYADREFLNFYFDAQERQAAGIEIRELLLPNGL